MLRGDPGTRGHTFVMVNAVTSSFGAAQTGKETCTINTNKAALRINEVNGVCLEAMQDKGLVEVWDCWGLNRVSRIGSEGRYTVVLTQVAKDRVEGMRKHAAAKEAREEAKAAAVQAELDTLTMEQLNMWGDWLRETSNLTGKDLVSEQSDDIFEQYGRRSSRCEESLSNLPK